MFRYIVRCIVWMTLIIPIIAIKGTIHIILQPNLSATIEKVAFVAAEKKGGWSNTAAEALAAGVPLIGTSTGTKDFLIQNETGLLVWRHPYFIRKAIEKLLTNPELAHKLAANGRRKIAEFSWEALADVIESYVSSRLMSTRLSE